MEEAISLNFSAIMICGRRRAGEFGASPQFLDGGFFACIAAVFRWPYGLYGIGDCMAALAVLVFMVMRMGYSETGEYDRERNRFMVEHASTLLSKIMGTFL